MKNICDKILSYSTKTKLPILLIAISLFCSINVFAQEADISNIDVAPLLGKWVRNFYSYSEEFSCKDILWIEEYDNQVTARLKQISKNEDDGKEHVRYPIVTTSVVDNKIRFCFEYNKWWNTDGTYVVVVDYWVVERQRGALKVDMTRKLFEYPTKDASRYYREDTVYKNRSVLFYPEADNW